jgi:hypothetical protein
MSEMEVPDSSVSDNEVGGDEDGDLIDEVYQYLTYGR